MVLSHLQKLSIPLLRLTLFKLINKKKDNLDWVCPYKLDFGQCLSVLDEISYKNYYTDDQKILLNKLRSIHNDLIKNGHIYTYHYMG